MKLSVIKLSVGTRIGLLLALVLMFGSMSRFALADDDNHGVDHSKGHSNDSEKCNKVARGHKGHGCDNGPGGHGGNGGNGGGGGNGGNGGNGANGGNGGGGGNGGNEGNGGNGGNGGTTGGYATAPQSQTAQGGNATNGGQSNAQSVEYQQVRQAPFAYSPDAIPSAPCRVAGSAGVSAPIGGISLGGSKMDNECDLRETARAFSLIGNRAAAAKILCQTKAAKKARLSETDCQTLEAAQAEPPAPSPVQIVMPGNQPAPPIAALPAVSAENVATAPASDLVREPETRLLGICTFAKAITCKPEGPAPAVITVSSICKQMLDAARKALRENPNSLLLVRGNRNPSEAASTATARANNIKRQLTASGVDPDRVKVETGKAPDRTVELVLVSHGE